MARCLPSSTAHGMTNPQTNCCINVTLLRKTLLTTKNDAPTSLARRSLEDLRTHFASLSVKSQRNTQATKRSIDKTVQRLAKRTNSNYRAAIDRRQVDETGELLVRVLSFLRPKFSRSDFADLHTHLLNMDADELSSFAQRFGWRN